jgi:uncharacterized membrane protein YiaA
VSNVLLPVSLYSVVSRLRAIIDRLYALETTLLKDLAVSAILFIGVSLLWEQAPSAWPQFIYYLVLAVALFGYFRFVSPPDNADRGS